MASIQYDDLIIGGLLGDAGDRWKRVVHDCQPEHFVGAHRQLFELGVRFFRATGFPLDYTSFTDMARQLDPAVRITLDAEFSRLWHTEVPEAHFRWAIQAIVDTRRDERFVGGLMEAMRTMTEGLGGEQGFEAARAKLAEALGDIDRNFADAPPYGNIRDDADQVWADYLEATQTKGVTTKTVLTGLAEVDDRIIGMRPGENMLVAAYSGEGKTTTIQNMAWNACTQQAKNVLVLTNENQYEQYRARVYNRHAHVLTQGGLRYNDIRTGSLSEAEAAVWQAACRDFGSNPAYGRLEIVQMPTNASMHWVVGQLDRYADEMDTDLVVLDYIGRLGAMTPRPTRRDEMNDNLNLWKSALVGFDHGAGVAGVTGYQTSRTTWEQAKLLGYYGLNCLAETAEAERNADVVISLLRMEGVEREALLQLLKNRDGSPLEPTPMVTDFATTLVTSAAGTGWLHAA